MLSSSTMNESDENRLLNIRHFQFPHRNGSRDKKSHKVEHYHQGAKDNSSRGCVEIQYSLQSGNELPHHIVLLLYGQVAAVSFQCRVCEMPFSLNDQQFAHFLMSKNVPPALARPQGYSISETFV